jgi:hypothetical protein
VMNGRRGLDLEMRLMAFHIYFSIRVCSFRVKTVSEKYFPWILIFHPFG